MRGKYNPPVLIEVPALSGIRIEQPMNGQDDSWATAVYIYHERRESSGKWLWKLDHIRETVPPMSPQEKARQFTDDARLPPLTPDGRIDWAEIARRREHEWCEYEQERTHG